MITDLDVKKLKKEFATKKDIDSVKREITSTEKYLDYKIEVSKKEADEFKKDFLDFKDKVLTNLDWIVLTLRKMDDEHTILTGRYSDVSEKLDNHEDRILVLEKKPSFQ